MKRSISTTIIALCLYLSLVPALGQTQLELNEESAKALKKADDALNAAYKELLAKLDDEGKTKLQAAEKAWIKFRDAECESAADDYRGGSIKPLIYNNCTKALTETRTADLKARLKELTGH